ncbi:hypothetical protein [Arthrobacter crystallopoietes]|nr:hypothetical protein [Arthrobacter crystallopoietes]AUI50902.1 hypothetical protein AC20117_08830 [Arthrobacter crystallopoietes]
MNMKPLLLSIVGGVLLAGCGAPETEPAPTISVAPAASAKATPTPTPTPTRNANSRGQVIKDVGETAWTELPDGTKDLKLKVTSIKPIECDAPYAGKPNGIPLAVTMEIETSPEFQGALEVNGQPGMISFTPYYWKGYAANGTRMNTVESDITHNCLADETRKLPDYLGKGEKVEGVVILDVATKKGSVAFDPYGEPGWIWNYPSK